MRWFIALLIVTSSCAQQCPGCVSQTQQQSYIVNIPQVVPVQGVAVPASSATRPCCNTVASNPQAQQVQQTPQQANPTRTQTIFYYGSTNGSGQQNAAIFSNFTTANQQQNFNYQNPNRPPVVINNNQQPNYIQPQTQYQGSTAIPTYNNDVYQQGQQSPGTQGPSIPAGYPSFNPQPSNNQGYNSANTDFNYGGNAQWQGQATGGPLPQNNQQGQYPGGVTQGEVQNPNYQDGQNEQFQNGEPVQEGGQYQGPPGTYNDQYQGGPPSQMPGSTAGTQSTGFIYSTTPFYGPSTQQPNIQSSTPNYNQDNGQTGFQYSTVNPNQPTGYPSTQPQNYQDGSTLNYNPGMSSTQQQNQQGTALPPLIYNEGLGNNNDNNMGGPSSIPPNYNQGEQQLPPNYSQGPPVMQPNYNEGPTQMPNVNNQGGPTNQPNNNQGGPTQYPPNYGDDGQQNQGNNNNQGGPTNQPPNYYEGGPTSQQPNYYEGGPTTMSPMNNQNDNNQNVFTNQPNFNQNDASNSPDYYNDGFSSTAMPPFNNEGGPQYQEQNNGSPSPIFINQGGPNQGANNFNQPNQQNQQPQNFDQSVNSGYATGGPVPAGNYNPNNNPNMGSSTPSYTQNGQTQYPMNNQNNQGSSAGPPSTFNDNGFSSTMSPQQVTSSYQGQQTATSQFPGGSQINNQGYPSTQNPNQGGFDPQNQNQGGFNQQNPNQGYSTTQTPNQGGFNPSTGYFPSSTMSPQQNQNNYNPNFINGGTNNQQQQSSTPLTPSSGTSPFGQNSAGSFVTPTSSTTMNVPSTTITNRPPTSTTRPPSTTTTGRGNANAGQVQPGGNQYDQNNPTTAPQNRPQYDTDHNMNTVYGHYNNSTSNANQPMQDDPNSPTPLPIKLSPGLSSFTSLVAFLILYLI